MKDAEKERRILRALIGDPLSSNALSNFAELTSGQLYPTLMRLEKEGKVVSEWADEPYPRRRMYRLQAGRDGDG